MDLDRIFVLNMKKWRKNRGLSQKTLAERCKAAHTYIRRLESGSRTPSFVFIGKIAEALDIEAYRLFYDETAVQNPRSGAENTPPQAARLAAIKTDILKKIAQGIDTVITEAQK